jgi:hypothetical protein
VLPVSRPTFDVKQQGAAMQREEYLEPMVVAAIEAKRGLPRPVRPASQEKSMEKRYLEGVRNDIEDIAAVRPSDAVLSQVKAEFPAASEEDIQDAIAAANTLHQLGLFVESEYGDGEGAVAELERQMPGFSQKLYKNIISYFGYINH